MSLAGHCEKRIVCTEMTSLLSVLQRRTRRWLVVTSATWRPRRPSRAFTLRDLLLTLEATRNRAILAPPPLTRLIAIVSGDLAVAVRYPERLGGPDTLRSLRDWRSRYDHLDRYLPRG
jgi:hypothetical protein